MKSLFIISLLLLVGGKTFAQFDAVHYVTSSSQTGPGSINEKIVLANGQANAGDNVIVYFDVPDINGDGEALISISSELTEISNPDGGSIWFAPNPGNSAKQGLKGNYPVSSTTNDLPGFKINNAKNITISKLHFENFRRESSAMPQNAIAVTSSEDVTVIGSSFENNQVGVNYFESYGEIKYNTFLNHVNSAIQYGDYANHLGQDKLDIINNTIAYDDTHSGHGAKAGVFVSLKSNNADFSILIKSNTISDTKKGINIEFKNTNCNSGIVNELSLSILENTIFSSDEIVANSHAIILNGVVADWVVEDNAIESQEFGIVYETGCDITFPTVPAEDNHTIDFIEANDLGYTPINTGNIIRNCNTSFSHRSNLSSKIIGYDVEGDIAGKPNRRTIIRQNIIRDIDHSDRPIIYETLDSEPMANKLTLDEATYAGGELNVQFDASGLATVNGPFKIDVYEADANGNLISYIGNEEITDNVVGHIWTLSGVLLSSGRIGVTITSTGAGVENNILGTSEVEFIDIVGAPCISCNSFVPTETKYWLSAWVNVEIPEGEQVKSFYTDETSPNLELSFYGSGTTSGNFYASGEIIDGWQRIVGEFTVPPGTIELLVVLNAHPNHDTYFDDIRIHPFNGSMKSYVYDGQTFWLTSELDDNNYATFYEYDEEGGLVRIKKETARGIVTIQETRSNTVKEETIEE